MIRLEGLSVSFGPVRAVIGVTAALSAEVTGVIGPNGAGKTTLLNAIAGSVPSQGVVQIDGADISTMSPFERARSGVRRTFQTDQVMLELSTLDNVLIGGDTMPRSGRRDLDEQAHDMLHLVGLEGPFSRPGRSLTNIERRKVEIARALIGRPRVLLMDEPGAGLLADEKAELETTITMIPKELNAQVVLIEHDIELVSRVCASSIVLNFGALIATGLPADVLADEQVRAAYLGESGAVPT